MNIKKFDATAVPRWAQHALPGYELANRYNFVLDSLVGTSETALYKRGDNFMPLFLMCTRAKVEAYFTCGEILITTGELPAGQSIGWRLMQLDVIRNTLAAAHSSPVAKEEQQ